MVLGVALPGADVPASRGADTVSFDCARDGLEDEAVETKPLNINAALAARIFIALMFRKRQDL